MDNIFTGLIPDPRTDDQKAKDYLHDEVYGASFVDWKEKTDFRNFPIRNQNGSGQCVAFSTAKALGVNNKVETGEFLTLSPRDIYTRRKNKDTTGMYLQDAGDISKKYGSTLDSLMPSDNLTEAQANNSSDRTPESEKLALMYRANGYVFIGNDSNVMDNIAQAIDKGYAPVLTNRFHISEWTDEPKILVPTEQANNFHAITIVDYFLKNGEKCFMIEDSWGSQYGNNGRRILSETWVRARMTGCMYLIDWVYSPVTKPKHTFSQVMIYGQENSEISALQDVLKYEGLIPSNVESTGFFGSITAKAVMNFQLKYNVAPLVEIKALQGKRCGKKTLQKLNELYS